MACEGSDNAKLLIVEDDDNARMALGDILDYEGYPVAMCCNGKEALDYLHSRPLPALIILDLQMPVMNGWQFCHECRRDVELASVPVVVITAFQSPGDLEVDAVIKKPIDIEHLLDMVHHYCDAESGGSYLGSV
jgi:CheY-like chemotaxis protein